MCHVRQSRMCSLILFASSMFNAGCAHLGILERPVPELQEEAATVKVLGPILHPQRIKMPARGLPLDQILESAQRPGSNLGSFGSLEMVYRQRGATRLFIPVMMVRNSALGSILVRDRDAIGCLNLTDTPIFGVAPTGSASVVTRGMLTIRSLRDAPGVNAELDSDGDIALKFSRTDISTPTTLYADFRASLGGEGDTIGASAGVLDSSGNVLLPEIFLLSRIGSDGYIEQYVFPANYDSNSGNLLETSMQAILDTVPISDGDVIDVTMIGLLPEVIAGSIKASLLTEQDLTERHRDGRKREKCVVQPGPTLRPVTSLIRNSASQTSSIFRSVSAPTINMFRFNDK